MPLRLAQSTCFHFSVTPTTACIDSITRRVSCLCHAHHLIVVGAWYWCCYVVYVQAFRHSGSGFIFCSQRPGSIVEAVAKCIRLIAVQQDFDCLSKFVCPKDFLSIRIKRRKAKKRKKKKRKKKLTTSSPPDNVVWMVAVGYKGMGGGGGEYVLMCVACTLLWVRSDVSVTVMVLESCNCSALSSRIC